MMCLKIEIGYRGPNIDVVIPIATSKGKDAVEVVSSCSDGTSQIRVRLDDADKIAQRNSFAVM